MSHEPALRALPTGTVTFLRTDVEGSMGHVRALGSAWDEINETHLAIIRRAVETSGGVAVRTEGDALFAAFPEAGAAVLAAVSAQRSIRSRRGPSRAACRSAWASTRARRTWPATTTAAST